VSSLAQRVKGYRTRTSSTSPSAPGRGDDSPEPTPTQVLRQRREPRSSLRRSTRDGACSLRIDSACIEDLINNPIGQLRNSLVKEAAPISLGDIRRSEQTILNGIESLLRVIDAVSQGIPGIFQPVLSTRGLLLDPVPSTASSRILSAGEHTARGEA